MHFTGSAVCFICRFLWDFFFVFRKITSFFFFYIFEQTCLLDVHVFCETAYLHFTYSWLFAFFG